MSRLEYIYMRFWPGLILVLTPFVFAQSADSPEIARAKAGIEKLRALVEAGDLTPTQLGATKCLATHETAHGSRTPRTPAGVRARSDLRRLRGEG